jgi:hypothetical protein
MLLQKIGTYLPDYMALHPGWPSSSQGHKNLKSHLKLCSHFSSSNRIGKVPCHWRMLSSGMLRHVALVRTDHQGDKNRWTRNSISCKLHGLLVMANVPSSPILVTLMMEELSSSETSALTGATRHNVREDGILHSYRSENLKSYKRFPVIISLFQTNSWYTVILDN